MVDNQGVCSKCTEDCSDGWGHSFKIKGVDYLCYSCIQDKLNTSYLITALLMMVIIIIV